MKFQISFSFILVILLAMLLAVPAFAGTTYNETVNVREDDNTVIAFGTLDMLSDSTGTYYTQAIYIGDCNLSNEAFFVGYTNAIANDDVNVYVEYSRDRTTWKLATAASGLIIDDLNGGTVQSDTINVQAGSRDLLYNGALWVRFKFVGQAANPILADVYWWAKFTKDVAKKPMNKTARVKDRLT